MLREWHDMVREDIKRLEPWQNRVEGLLVPEFKGRLVKLIFITEGKTIYLESIYRPSRVTRSLVDYWLTYSVIHKGSVSVMSDSMTKGMKFLEKYPEQILGLLEINTSSVNNKFWNHLARRMLGCL